MPVSFSQIARNTATVTITGGTLGEDSITIVYYPARITDNLLNSMQMLMTIDQAGASSGIDGITSLNDGLAQLIQSWDVLDADGGMFPLEPKRLKELPIPFKVEVLYAIVNDLRPEALAPHLNGRG